MLTANFFVKVFRKDYLQTSKNKTLILVLPRCLQSEFSIYVTHIFSYTQGYFPQDLSWEVFSITDNHEIINQTSKRCDFPRQTKKCLQVLAPFFRTRTGLVFTKKARPFDSYRPQNTVYKPEKHAYRTSFSFELV